MGQIAISNLPSTPAPMGQKNLVFFLDGVLTTIDPEGVIRQLGISSQGEGSSPQEGSGLLQVEVEALNDSLVTINAGDLVTDTLVLSATFMEDTLYTGLAYMAPDGPYGDVGDDPEATVRVRPISLLPSAENVEVGSGSGVPPLPQFVPRMYLALEHVAPGEKGRFLLNGFTNMISFESQPGSGTDVMLLEGENSPKITFSKTPEGSIVPSPNRLREMGQLVAIAGTEAVSIPIDPTDQIQGILANAPFDPEAVNLGRGGTAAGFLSAGGERFTISSSGEISGGGTVDLNTGAYTLPAGYPTFPDSESSGFVFFSLTPLNPKPPVCLFRGDTPQPMTQTLWSARSENPEPEDLVPILDRSSKLWKWSTASDLADSAAGFDLYEVEETQQQVFIESNFEGIWNSDHVVIDRRTFGNSLSLEVVLPSSAPDGFKFTIKVIQIGEDPISLSAGGSAQISLKVGNPPGPYSPGGFLILRGEATTFAGEFFGSTTVYCISAEEYP